MDGKYVQMPRELLLRKSISLKAKGLYALILALPTNWECSVAELVETSGAGKSMIQAAIKELEQNGYLERHQVTDENGQFFGMEYELKER